MLAEAKRAKQELKRILSDYTDQLNKFEAY
ncbi:hypothetical protein ES703_92079 [subsurface metagenome]